MTYRAPPIRSILTLSFSLGLTGCNVTTGDLFVDPAKYTFYNCEHLKVAAETEARRAGELQGLMARANRDPGGDFISLIAYRTDYLKAQGSYQLARRQQKEKGCFGGQFRARAPKARANVRLNPKATDVLRGRE